MKKPNLEKEIFTKEDKKTVDDSLKAYEKELKTKGGKWKPRLRAIAVHTDLSGKYAENVIKDIAEEIEDAFKSQQADFKNILSKSFEAIKIKPRYTPGETNYSRGYANSEDVIIKRQNQKIEEVKSKLLKKL